MYSPLTANIGPQPGATLGMGQIVSAISNVVPIVGQITSPTPPVRTKHPILRKQIGRDIRRDALRHYVRVHRGSVVSPTSVQASANGVSGLGDDTVDFSSYFSDPGSTSYLPVTPVITSTPGLIQVGSNTYDPSNPNNILDLTGGDVSGGAVSATGTDLTSVLNSIISQAGNISKLVLTPGGSYTSYNPTTGQTVTYQGTGTTPTGLSIPGLTSTTISPTMLLLLGGGVLLIMMMGKK